MSTATEFRLDTLDIESRTWKRLKPYLEARLHKLRCANDKDSDPIATAKLRGRIDVIKDLLALETPPAPAMGADEEHGV